MQHRELKVNIRKELVDDFTNFIESRGIQNYFETLLDLEQEEREFLADDTNLFIYLEQEDIEKELEILIYLKLNASESGFCESRIIESKDYEEAYKEYYKPFAISNFVLIPSWKKQETQIQKSQIPLYLNPGLAFGTGHHETTHLMLQQMEKVIEPGMKVLDMGTGSGILSIAAALLGGQEILAIDIDKNAVSACQANWQHNELPEANIQILAGSFELTEIQNRSFDIMLANITYAVLSGNISAIKHIKTKRFLFSGLLAQKQQMALQLFSTLGGKSIDIVIKNDWLLVDWQR